MLGHSILDWMYQKVEKKCWKNNREKTKKIYNLIISISQVEIGETTFFDYNIHKITFLDLINTKIKHIFKINLIFVIISRV